MRKLQSELENSLLAAGALPGLRGCIVRHNENVVTERRSKGLEDMTI